jgi:hypothetical protein
MNMKRTIDMNGTTTNKMNMKNSAKTKTKNENMDAALDPV